MSDVENTVSSHSDRFFAHHGVFAPGIKLFRRLDFPGKSAWVLAAMLAPVVMLLWQIYHLQMEGIEATQAERRGVQYVNKVTVLLEQLETYRAAAMAGGPDLASSQSAVQASLAAVSQLDKEHDAVFHKETSENLALLEKTIREVVASPVRATVDESYAAHTAASEAALKLLGDIGDASGLALDPEIDTYHLMVLTVTVGPQYVEYLSRLRDLGGATLSAGADKPVPPKRLRDMERNFTLIGYVDPIYENSYGKGVETFPEVAAGMDMKGVDSTREAFLAMLEKDVLSEARAGQSQTLGGAAATALDKQWQLNKKVMTLLEDRLQARISRIQSEMRLDLTVAACFLAITFYLLLCFYRVTKGGLSLVSTHLQELATGDLRHRPSEPLGKDEQALLIGDLQKVYDSMRELIRRVRHSARELANTSAEVSRASLDLSHRTEDAASHLGEQAGAMQHINDQINQSAQRTSEAAVMAGGNAEVAEQGGKIIANVVETMQAIRASSTRINEIIGTIDGIAFQTNILALNAAVEAARAGESGRGFAVVAAEVRSLAGRSAVAAKEIKELISDSEAKVTDGAKVVEAAGYNIAEIVANAKQINLFLDEIAGATRSQALEVENVVGAIGQLDANTQQNAALVEQTSASAESLSDQATHLTQEIARFKVG